MVLCISRVSIVYHDGLVPVFCVRASTTTISMAVIVCHCIRSVSLYCLCIENIYHIIIVLIKIFPDNYLWTSHKACGFVISILRLRYSLCPMSCEFMVVIGWIIYCILLGA